MFIKANEKQKNEILEFLKQNKSENFFFISDIETYGLFAENISTYIVLEKNKVVACLMNFQKTLLFYDPLHKVNYNQIKSFIDENKIRNWILFSETFNRFEKEIKDDNYIIKSEILAELSTLAPVNNNFATETKINDVANLCVSKSQIAEFKTLMSSLDDEIYKITKAIEAKRYYGFCVYDHNEIVSAASTASITDDVAIIGGVFTLPKARQKGYASECVARLHNLLLSKGIKTMLFYDNLQAGRIYNSLGYREISKLFVLKHPKYN